MKEVESNTERQQYVNRCILGAVMGKSYDSEEQQKELDLVFERAYLIHSKESYMLQQNKEIETVLLFEEARVQREVLAALMAGHECLLKNRLQHEFTKFHPSEQIKLFQCSINMSYQSLNPLLLYELNALDWLHRVESGVISNSDQITLLAKRIPITATRSIAPSLAHNQLEQYWYLEQEMLKTNSNNTPLFWLEHTLRNTARKSKEIKIRAIALWLVDTYHIQQTRRDLLASVKDHLEYDWSVLDSPEKFKEHVIACVQERASWNSDGYWVNFAKVLKSQEQNSVEDQFYNVLNNVEMKKTLNPQKEMKTMQTIKERNPKEESQGKRSKRL